MGELSTSKQLSEKRLGLLDFIQPILLLTAIMIGLSLAKLTPVITKRLVPIVSVGVFLVIYFIMLEIDIQSIIVAFTKIKPTIISIIINFLFTPFFAWLLGFLFLRNYPDIWVGLILYLITPCIGWYLIFTDLAGGDVPLGVALLSWNIFLQIALIPVYMPILAGRLVSINILSIFYSVIIFLILPFFLSRITRAFLKKKSTSMEEFSNNIKLSYLKTIVLMVVIIAMFASQGNVLFQNPYIVLKMIFPGLIFFLTVFVISLFIGYFFKLKYREVALLVFTTAARNSEVSLAIAVGAFSSPLISLTVVIGPIIELPVLVLFLNLLRVVKRKKIYIED